MRLRWRCFSLVILALPIVAAATFVLSVHGFSTEPSSCFGSKSHGRLAQGWRLPREGRNFTVYSLRAWLLGKTYLHSAIQKLVLDAYQRVERTNPGRHYVYGDASRVTGGEFAPHRSHQNGLSIDFLVPVIDEAGMPATLPVGAYAEHGYGIEFDAAGRSGKLRIDYEALALHLASIQAAARERKIGISKVVFDPDVRRPLHGTSVAAAISTLPYNRAPAWIRHDHFYHIDFSYPCRTIGRYGQ